MIIHAITEDKGAVQADVPEEHARKLLVGLAKDGAVRLKAKDVEVTIVAIIVGNEDVIKNHLIFMRKDDVQ